MQEVNLQLNIFKIHSNSESTTAAMTMSRVVMNYKLGQFIETNKQLNKFKIGRNINRKVSVCKNHVFLQLVFCPESPLLQLSVSS